MDPKQSYQPAFVLHTRPYRETSLLVELFTANFGRVPAVAKGGRQPQRNRQAFQLFQPIQVTWSGRSELKSLRQIETTAQHFKLEGARIYTGMYLNEILIRLLTTHESNPTLFANYLACLQTLSANADVLTEERCLRQFELTLITTLGYGIDFSHEYGSDLPIEKEKSYYFHTQGFEPINDSVSGKMPVIAGAEILAMANGEWDAVILQKLKWVTRLAVEAHLGDKPLNSRLLYQQAKSTYSNS